MRDLSVDYKNPGHWDIYEDGRKIYKIRGVPGSYIVIDCINTYNNKEDLTTVGDCMSYICDQGYVCNRLI